MTNANPAVPATEIKLTQLEKLNAKYDKLVIKANALSVEITEVVNAINGIVALASITEGTTVIINIGKGETAAEVEGVVIGVKDDAAGVKVYKVQYGSGFDADIAVVKQGRIKLVPAAEVPADE